MFRQEERNLKRKIKKKEKKENQKRKQKSRNVGGFQSIAKNNEHFDIKKILKRNKKNEMKGFYFFME